MNMINPKTNLNRFSKTILISILCFLLVFPIYISEKNQPKAEPVSTVLIVGAGTIGAIIGFISYEIDRRLEGEEHDSIRLAASMTAGAAGAIATILVACFPPSALLTVLGVVNVPGITIVLTDFFEGVFLQIAELAENATFFLSGQFKEDINNLSPQLENLLESTVQSLIVTNGGEPNLNYSLPTWVDFAETIDSQNMTVETVAMEYSDYYGTWRMTTPGTSQVEMTFTLDSVPSDVLLSLLHLTSADSQATNGGYSPIDIYINGSLFLNNYDVAEKYGDHGWHTDDWAIAPYLRAGINTILIEFEDDPWAATHYWLRHMSVREGVVVPTYTITPTSGSNGSISPSAITTVSPGDSVTFTASPNTGYIVDRWYNNGVEIPDSEEELSLPLSNIQEDTTILITFKSTGSSSQVYVAGSLDPDSISFSLAAGGSGKWYNIPVQNRGSSTISVNANFTGDAAGWASMSSSDSSFTLDQDETKKSKVSVFAPENASAGTHTLNVSYNGTVLPFSILVTVPGEDYEDVIDAGTAVIGGSNWTAENVDIPANVWNDVDDGFHDSIRLYAHVDSVSSGGTLSLYDAGFNYLMSTSGINPTSRVGNDISWPITKYRLDKDDNTFGIAGPAGINLQLSNFRFVITFYTETPDIKITKSLSSDTAAVGENITVTVTAENFAENSTTGFDVELKDSLPSGISLVSGSLNDNDFGDLEEEAKSNVYTIVANQPGYYTLPSARLEYESINGDDLTEESIPVELLVTAGQLLVNAQITPPITAPGNVDFIVTITDPVTNLPLQDVSVQGVLQKQNGTDWETIQTSPLGWSTADSAFVGVSPEITTAGEYRAYVVSQKELYDEGQSASTSFTINAMVLVLNSGWNLISLPLLPEDTDITVVLSSISDNYSIVWAYDNGLWKAYDPQYHELSDLLTMDAGIGYWINMTESDELTVTGTIPSNSTSLSSDWNLIGYNSSTSQPIGDALASISDKYISVWTLTNDEWKVYDPNNTGSSTLTTMEAGYGYWINMSESATWTLP